jgi:hypothetical protein
MSNEPQFEAYRKRVLTGSFALCIAGVPIGLVLHLPYVWILGIVGIVVSGWELSKIREHEQEGTTSGEPQFEAYQKRVLIGCIVVCAVSTPIGLLVHMPYTWIIGVVGIVGAGWKLSQIQKRERERK